MPAVSKKQRMLMAIAEHRPSKLYKRNRDVLSMSKSQLHDYASTKEAGLPRRMGNPRTNEERMARHKSLYGTEKLPPRGTGIRRSEMIKNIAKRKGG